MCGCGVWVGGVCAEKKYANLQKNYNELEAEHSELTKQHAEISAQAKLSSLANARQQELSASRELEEAQRQSRLLAQHAIELDSVTSRHAPHKH